MKGKHQSIDEYLQTVTDDQRAALERLRATVLAAAPGAQECVSYGLAAFRLAGKALVAIGATKKHCAFYPMSSTTVESFREELRDFDTSKGTVRFQPDRPLPLDLVRRMVLARIAEDQGAPPESS